MLTNSLRRFAEKYDWDVTADLDFVYGQHHGYLYSLMSGRGFTAVFVCVAGITQESLYCLQTELEEKRPGWRMLDFELSDNFLCLRLKENIIQRRPSQLYDLIERLSNLFDQIDLPKECCAVCGQPAEQRGLYLDLFCAMHPACEQREGIDFTVQTTVQEE